MHLGDFAVGKTIHHKFTTRRFSSGAPFTLAGTPVVSVYEDDSTTQITAGITLTVDFDSVTGLNHLTIVATSGNGYEAGKTYHMVITTGTVDSVSVVGEVVGSFTMEKTAALRPTTADRTLDVAATGEAGLDFDNIKAATGATTLTNITVPTVTTLTGHTAQTGDAFARLGAPAGASVSADVAAVKAQTAAIEVDTQDLQTQIGAAGAGLTAADDAILARLGAPAGASVSADIAAVKGDTAAILADTGTDGVVVAAGSKTGYALSAAGVQAIWDALTAALTTANSIGKLLVDNVNATISSRASQTSVDTIDDLLDTEVAAILAAVDTEIAAIKAKTDQLTFTVANKVDANMTTINGTAMTGDGTATPWGPA